MFSFPLALVNFRSSCFRCSCVPQQRVHFLSCSVSGQSFRDHPPISDENVLAVTFSAGRAHHDPVCIKGEDKIVYFITRLNISLGVLDYVLKDTDREDKGQQKVLLPLRFASEFNSALLSRISFEYTVH